MKSPSNCDPEVRQSRRDTRGLLRFICVRRSFYRLIRAFGLNTSDCVLPLFEFSCWRFSLSFRLCSLVGVDPWYLTFSCLWEGDFGKRVSPRPNCFAVLEIEGSCACGILQSCLLGVPRTFEHWFLKVGVPVGAHILRLLLPGSTLETLCPESLSL